MSVDIAIVIFLYFLISSINIVFLYNKYRLCPEVLWCASQFLMFFGITHFIDGERQSDRLLLCLYLVALISFIISSNFAQKIYNPYRNVKLNKRPDYYKSRKYYVWFLMIVSIILCSRFFARGGNVFLNGIVALIRGSDYSTKYSRMRLLSVSGVGYIYQFRVIIFPLLVLYYVTMKKLTISSIVLMLIMLIFLVGTGQRGGLFSYIAIVIIAIYYLFNKNSDNDNPKKINKISLYISVLGFSGVLFGFSTALNGRVAAGKTVYSAILQRFIEDNQNSAIWGFRYIYSQPIQYGRDWLYSLLDILPGKNSYMSLDTRIFAYIYGGSTAGTSPPCIWGSAYYNFGLFGVIILSFLLGLFITKLHAKYSHKYNDEFSIIVYSAEQFLLAYWVAAGPIVLFNSGFITVVLLDIIMHMALRHPIVVHSKL